jgi:hypothetical protein
MMLSLPKSRQSFWQTVRKDGNDAESLCVGEKIYFLPEAINVSHKIRTVSGCVEEFLPAKIKPLSVNAEKIIIETLMSEIEATHIIETDKNPNLDRCSGGVTQSLLTMRMWGEEYSPSVPPTLRDLLAALRSVA